MPGQRSTSIAAEQPSARTWLIVNLVAALVLFGQALALRIGAGPLHLHVPDAGQAHTHSHVDGQRHAHPHDADETSMVELDGAAQAAEEGAAGSPGLMAAVWPVAASLHLAGAAQPAPGPRADWRNADPDPPEHRPRG